MFAPRFRIFLQDLFQSKLCVLCGWEHCHLAETLQETCKAFKPIKHYAPIIIMYCIFANIYIQLLYMSDDMYLA